MARLIFIALLAVALLIGLAVALKAITAAFNNATPDHSQGNEKEDSMPSVVRKFSYIGLLMIMFAAAAGALGGF